MTDRARAEEAPGIDVVLVAFRCRELLRRCLRSLQEHRSAAPMSVFVVDNDSADGTLEMLAAEFPQALVFDQRRNSGFAAATNVGIRAGSSPYVLVLNPDTELTAGALDSLLELMERRTDIGMCGCRLELEDGSLDHAARRSFPTVLGALGHFTGLGRRGSAPKALAQYRAPDVESGPVDAINGAFMLIRRGALAEVGLFDEGYWMYMEDLDLCYRFAQAGWRVWYDPSVAVRHVKGGTTGRRRTVKLDYAFHYGMLRFYRKFYARNRSALVNAVVYAGIATKLGTSVLRGALAGVAGR